MIAALCPHDVPSLPAFVSSGLPDVYFEDGFGRDAAVFGGDSLWQLPNTFPMIRWDIRARNQPEGWSYNDATYDIAASAASNVIRTKWVWDSLTPYWPAGKPKRYAVLVAGPDLPTTPVNLCRHATDSIAANIGSPFPIVGTAQTKTYFQGVYPATADGLQLQGLPRPVRCFTDMENEGDAHGASPTIWPIMLADARASNATAFDGEQSLATWAAAHGTTNTGAAIPAYNGAVYDPAYHPDNWHYAQRCRAAIRRAGMRAVSVAMYDTYTATFGQVPFGDWAVLCGSVPGQVQFRPYQTWYQGVYYGSASMVSPVMYGGPMELRFDGDGSRTANDTRWETQQNWAAYMGFAVPTTAVDYMTLGGATLLQNVQQLRAATPGREIVPSVSQVYVGRNGGTGNPINDTRANTATLKAAAAVQLGRAMARAFNAGASAFWLFESSWCPFNNTDSDLDRAAVAAYVTEMNTRILARNYT